METSVQMATLQGRRGQHDTASSLRALSCVGAWADLPFHRPHALAFPLGVGGQGTAEAEES